MFLTSHSAFIFPIILKKVVPGCQHLGMNSEKNLFSLQQKKLWLFHTYYEASLDKWRENQSEQGACGKYPAPHLPALLITFLGETHLVTLALQLGKWRLREVKEFSQGHTLGNQGWNISLLNCKAAALFPHTLPPCTSLPLIRETSNHLFQYPHFTDTKAQRPGQQLDLSQVMWITGDRASMGTGSAPKQQKAPAYWDQQENSTTGIGKEDGDCEPESRGSWPFKVKEGVDSQRRALRSEQSTNCSFNQVGGARTAAAGLSLQVERELCRKSGPGEGTTCSVNTFWSVAELVPERCKQWSEARRPLGKNWSKSLHP